MISVTKLIVLYVKRAEEINRNNDDNECEKGEETRSAQKMLSKFPKNG